MGIKITLPDGSERNYDGPVSARQVAQDIGPGLAKAALGARINGEVADLDCPITADATLAIITGKGETPDPDALFLIRHSAAHVMAEAIQNFTPAQSWPMARRWKMVSTTTSTARRRCPRKTSRRSKPRWNGSSRKTAPLHATR